jgi:hypothetical protein
LADTISGYFIEGDDHSPDDKPWYASSHSTARSIRAEILVNERIGKPVIVAYPLRCIEWLFYRRSLINEGVSPIFISLAARFEAITSSDRGRVFTDRERRRIAEMLDQGYDRRSFSDLIVRTDDAPFGLVVSRLAAEVEAYVANHR